jgi:hypothetical protein
LSAVEWLSQTDKTLQCYNVLLILIDAKPGGDTYGTKWPWQKQLVGPVETLLNVRTSSQQVRESLELKMARSYLATADPTVSPKDASAIYVIPEPFLFWSRSLAPLSWHLTTPQKREIGGAWNDHDNQEAWRDVRTALHCSCDPGILEKAATGSPD